MDEPGLLGCRVQLIAEEGHYEGTVHAVDAASGVLTLVGVTFEAGDLLRGPQRFSRGDIRNVKVLEAGPDTPPPSQQQRGGPAGRALPPRQDRMVMESRQSDEDRRRLRCSQDLVDDSLLLAQVALDDSDDSTEGDAGDRRASAPRPVSPPPVLPRPSAFSLVDQTGDELAEAVTFLCQQRIVGLSSEGVLIGRKGQLSLLTVSSSEFSFVFDMPTLGRQAMESLRPLLETRDVQKVIHDCRRLSDLLTHQYGVRLANVFDTQAAEAYLYHQRHGQVPAYVSGVAHTLVTRLGLIPRQVFFPRYRLEKMREEQQVWLRRPLSETLLDGAVKNAVYLRELKHVQEQEMFSRFVRCVDVYLGSIRDGDDEDAASAPYESHRLPVHVQTTLQEPQRPHPRAAADPANPHVVTNVVYGADQRVGFTRNVYRPQRPN